MCEECGHKYKSAQALRIHRKRVHARNCKLHQCSHCDLKFERKEKLNAHLSVLSGVKPFHCRLCNNGYTLFSCLLKHFRRHHIGETVFFCKSCNFGTNSRHAHKSHVALLQHIQLTKGVVDDLTSVTDQVVRTSGQSN